MKLLMLCELEMPNDFFEGAKVANKLQPAWLTLMDEVQATANELNLKVISVRCEQVRPRDKLAAGKKANGSATPRQTRRTFTLPHAQLPVDETV